MNYSSENRRFHDNECTGPRPPVPGEESHFKKMTEKVGDCMRNSPPTFLNWARALNYLFEDREGVDLFKKYVEDETPAYNDHLNFYFACEGLKQQTDPEKIKQIILAIYRFLRKSQLSISEELRQTIKSSLKNEVSLGPNIFDDMQKQVEVIIRENIYPSFLCSDMYISYIQQMTVANERFSSYGGPGSCTTDSSSGSGISCGSNSGGSSQTTGASASIVDKGVISCTNITSSTVNFPVNLSIPTTAIGSCSASGSVYGPSTSASSSGSISATETLPRSSTLPTLHEDSELSLNDSFDKVHIEGDCASAEMPMRLTRDLLLATQTRRLEIRPPGALGYVYAGKPIASFVPNSRVDSERTSISSGGRTDSDTMSLSSCSLDGRPYVQRKYGSSESKTIRQCAMTNRETSISQVIPRTQRLLSNEHRPLKETEFIALLIPKLEEVKRKQDLEERARIELLPSETLPINERLTSDRSFAQAIREKFILDEDNDQDILDQHVSRVWKDHTPRRSPSLMSPCPPLPSRRRGLMQDITAVSGDTASKSTSGHVMKHSKSMPDHNSSSKKLTNKWPSVNTDSGISLYSTDILLKYKGNCLRFGCPNTSLKLEEAKRRLEDESKRPRRYTHSNSLPLQAPAPFIANNSSSNNNSVHQMPPPLPAKPQDTTIVVFSFCDEEYPYRTKIPGIQPTLKQFKDYLPKKGNFRFFFKTHCEDPDNPVIQEEIVNDMDTLPLFEGKVMGLVKPCE